MRLSGSTRTKDQNVTGIFQPGGLFCKLHESRRIETGKVRKLKIRPRFSVRQLRFGERAGNPGLVAALSLAFCQC